MNRKLLIFVLAFFLSAARNFSCLQEKYRLPSMVKATFYTIKIHPNFDSETFTGEVFMNLRVHDSVDSIEFHASNLTITSMFFDSKEVFRIRPCCFFEFGFEETKFELIRIVRNNGILIPPGAHVIHIKYHGNFSKTTEGLFKTGFTKYNKTHSHLVATDFQPTRARQAVPCFDEPGFKARYQLSVVVPNSTYVALSNMRVAEKYEVADGILYKFETTPLMSIYLLSFVVTQHTYNEYIGVSNVPIRGYSFNASKSNSTRLLEFADKVIRFYSDYTNFNYSLPKIDFVEYDRKETTATENWGLVTFNTSLLCTEDDVYDDSQKMGVIAHELAHFWFGNLVTNAWWDDLWLQESLATFMSLKAEDSVLENGASRDFYAMYGENLFWLDSKKDSNSVIHFQESPTEIRQSFSDIAYIKGASVLRMTEGLLGKDNMQKALRKYVRKYAFRTATTDDFISVVSNYTRDVNLREFMESYLYQNEFPVVFVEEDEDNYVLKQGNSGSFVETTGPSIEHKWTIPVTYLTDLTLDGDHHMIWLHKDQEKIILPKNNTAWIKLNYRQIGYYRVYYSNKLWDLFTKHNQQLDVSEKSHLLTEAAGLFDLNLGSCETALNYFWALCDNKEEFDFGSAYSFYFKLDEHIKQYSEEASVQLKEFLGRALEKIGVKRRQIRHSKGVPKEKINVPEDIQSCIDWLNNNTNHTL